MQTIRLENGPVRFVGALDFDRRPTGIVPRRLPNWTRPQVPLFMEIMVTMPSGVRLEFATTSRTIELDVLPTRIEISKPPAPAVFDLVIDGHDIRSAKTECGDRLKIKRSRGKKHPDKGNGKTGHPDMHLDKVVQPCFGRFRFPVIKHHQHEGGKRHYFPGDQECKTVPQHANP